MIICAESCKYFIYIPESGDDSFLTRSMCVGIPAFLTLALYFVHLPDLFPFANGRDLPWPFFSLAMGVSYHDHFLFNFFPQLAWVIITFSFLQWAGVISTGLPTPTFHKSAQFEVISFTHFISCPLPFIYCLLEFSGFKWFCLRLALFFHQ